MATGRGPYLPAHPGIFPQWHRLSTWAIPAPPHTHTSQQSLGHHYFLRAQKRMALEHPKQAGQDLSVESPSELVGYVAVWCPCLPQVWAASPGFGKVLPKGPQLSVRTYEAWPVLLTRCGAQGQGGAVADAAVINALRSCGWVQKKFPVCRFLLTRVQLPVPFLHKMDINIVFCPW